jgi:hypothetical protein
MLRVPLNRLPQSPIDRHAALREYFCDKDAHARRLDEQWCLTLYWPDGLDRHVDSQLQLGFEWWNEGVTRSTMVFARRRAERILTSLYDTWTLHSWSEWLARAGGRNTNTVTVLHVDDHRDLASPRIYLRNGEFEDAITGASVNLTQPESVRDAILSGALGMGSFLTPFLYKYPTVTVRHLCQPPKIALTQEYTFDRSKEPDTLLRPDLFRPAIRLVPQTRSAGPGSYQVTSDVNHWLQALPDGPVLLHVDMDYFNNRYDGDCDWSKRPDAFDPSLETIFNKIDELVATLHDRRLGGRIEDIVISYSPGFFPAEFWREADSRIRSGLESIS